ncbi:pimeloyl-[acyl-carrier protein] methyl ester esterase [Ectothiorhodospiraceae bacterium BW-2]|nr:pimeloyl-[acyl-carrier protein] methyl ester esterase [Ectothiorhodospiraceae bacterium BW-2]
MSSPHLPNLVLIHGWGTHSGIWHTLKPRLEPHYRLHLLDLPGYGPQQGWQGAWSLDSMVAYIADNVPPQSIWCGWSLGGMIALHAAASGLELQQVVVCGTTPCFCERYDWPHGLSEETLKLFYHELQQHPHATLLRFLALQTQGSEQAQQELRFLRQQISRYSEPSTAVLTAGLSILLHDDLRPYLEDIRCPVSAIHGERDRLAPASALDQWLAPLPQSHYQLIKGAGHAPFLSHPQQFSQLLQQHLIPSK